MDEFKILLVEDDQTWQHILQDKLQRAFSQMGHPEDRVHLVDNFGEADRKLRESRWDLVVTDIALGDSTAASMRLGIQLVELARDRQIPAIAVSGSMKVTTQDVRNILLQYRASDFFSKQDFDNSEFINRVKALLLHRDGLDFPIKILFLTANPSETTRLRIDREIRDINEILRRTEVGKNFIVETRTAVRPSDISQAILDFQPAIMHFSGHGINNGDLLLENEIGEVQPISATNFAGYFARIQSQTPLHCIILNACHGATLAQALKQYIPYVIGMETAISDDAAIKFASGFYKALVKHCPIPEAYNLGCGEIQLHNLPEDLTPQLYTRKAE